MAKIIIEVSDGLHKAVKIKAAKSGKTLKAILTELLEGWIK